MNDAPESQAERAGSNSPPADANVDADAALKKIRKSRNLVLGLLLAAFVILVYAISIVKIG
jgi:hypothetical protein